MNRSFKNISVSIFQFIFVIAIFVFPMIIMFSQYRKVPLVFHDLYILYGKDFLHPEHGRYIATWFGNFLIERLPVLLNIHVSDLNETIILGIKSFLFTIIFSLVSFGFFLFFDKKNKKDIWIWLLGYIVSFFIFFNRDLFFLNFIETTVFLEYIVALIPFLIFLSGIIYFYTKEKIPTKPVFILILLATFFSGITVELLNIPSFIFISLVTLFVLIDYLKSDKLNLLKKQRFKLFLTIFFVHIFSIILYYINPTDHQLINKEMFLFYWEVHLLSVQDFFVIKLLSFHILNIVGMILILISRKNELEQNIRFISSVVLINFSFLFYYTIVLYLIIFYFLFYYEEKFLYPYIVILLFNNFTILGYLISSYTSLEGKKLCISKILAIILIVLTNYEFINKSFVKNYKEIKNGCKEYSQIVYQIEKSVIKQRGQETIIIPAKDFNLTPSDDIRSSYYIVWAILYYPDFENVKTIIFDANLEPDELTEEEKKNLRFSDLLPHKINKFQGNYDSLFEIKKEKKEGSRVYFKKR